jgi:hypothetical protein
VLVLACSLPEFQVRWVVPGVNTALLMIAPTGTRGPELDHLRWVLTCLKRGQPEPRAGPRMQPSRIPGAVGRSWCEHSFTDDCTHRYAWTRTGPPAMGSDVPQEGSTGASCWSSHACQSMNGHGMRSCIDCRIQCRIECRGFTHQQSL